MPIYEYQCDACDHKFEVIQKVSDGLLTECPVCKQHKLRKMLTAAAFRLKGGGWYETDFKDKKSQKNTDSGSDNSGTADKSDKPAAADSGSGDKDSKTTTPEKSTTTETKETKPTTAAPASTPKPAAE